MRVSSFFVYLLCGVGGSARQTHFFVLVLPYPAAYLKVGWRVK